MGKNNKKKEIQLYGDFVPKSDPKIGYGILGTFINMFLGGVSHILYTYPSNNIAIVTECYFPLITIGLGAISGAATVNSKANSENIVGGVIGGVAGLAAYELTDLVLDSINKTNHPGAQQTLQDMYTLISNHANETILTVSRSVDQIKPTLETAMNHLASVGYNYIETLRQMGQDSIQIAHTLSHAATQAIGNVELMQHTINYAQLHLPQIAQYTHMLQAHLS